MSEDLDTPTSTTGGAEEASSAALDIRQSRGRTGPATGGPVATVCGGW